MIFLTPCEGCNRHVLSSEVQCPFCSARVTSAMRAREPRLPTKRLGRAAMVAFSATVATVATTACGGDEESDDTRQPSSENTSMPSASTNPSMSGSMGNLPSPSPAPSGTPTSPSGEPMAVALYGVAIDPGLVPPGGATPGAPPPPPVSPVMEPEPIFAADYGAPPLEPETAAAIYGAPALEPTAPHQGVGGAASVDPAEGGASNADAGVSDADAGTEPVMEPEPLGVAEYGVPPLELD